MSELVYRRTMRGDITAEIWHGETSDHDNAFTKTIGNADGEKRPVEPAYFDTVLARIPIKDGEEALGIEALMRMYPPPLPLPSKHTNVGQGHLRGVRLRMDEG